MNSSLDSPTFLLQDRVTRTVLFVVLGFLKLLSEINKYIKVENNGYQRALKIYLAIRQLKSFGKILKK